MHRTMCAVCAAAAFALTMQPVNASAQSPEGIEIWVSELWEHKIELTVGFVVSDMESAGRADQLRTELFEGNLPAVQHRANEEAVWACDFYGREAVGPINTRWHSEVGWSKAIQTFACALP